MSETLSPEDEHKARKQAAREAWEKWDDATRPSLLPGYVGGSLVSSQPTHHVDANLEMEDHAFGESRPHRLTVRLWLGWPGRSGCSGSTLYEMTLNADGMLGEHHREPELPIYCPRCGERICEDQIGDDGENCKDCQPEPSPPEWGDLD